MRYLIISSIHSPIRSDIQYQNIFNDGYDVTIYDLINNIYSNDGNNWYPIETD
ncbi:MAG: hypothetical protein WD512_10500 [Candidatus Paceibacterota bacterium]